MKADLISAWLFNEGYKHEIDQDGDIHFKYEGKHLYFTPDDDEGYFRLIMPNVYDVDGDRMKVLEACTTICRKYKVAKAYIVNDRVWVAIEIFVDSTPEINDFFERACNILIKCHEEIYKEIQG